MKLAAIDIGTNSIHMIIVEAIAQQQFEIIEREKEMVKLGVGVFASNRLSDRAFGTGVATIARYVQLAEQIGVDEVITAATSAIREAQNGDAFMQAVRQQTGVTPRIISGQEEARLIFLAVRNSIALNQETALVLDIGGGSTEAVIGNRQEVLFGDSMPLGVLRLLDMVGSSGPLGKEGRSVLEAHIRFAAQQTLERMTDIGFDRVIGTSGTIRTIGEAAYRQSQGGSLQSVNAEVVSLKAIEAVTQTLTKLAMEARTEVEGVSAKRADAIHLGGVLLTQLLNLAKVQEITLCEASLREGMVLDYLARHGPPASMTAIPANLRYRKAAQLVQKYRADWPRNCHVANLALQMFDQTAALHGYGTFERNVLEYGALLHDLGQFISFRKHHKNSRYIIKRAEPRGFTDDELLLIRHLARYHCKAPPTKKHKKFRKLSKAHRQRVQVLSGMLRIAVGLDKTKTQRVSSVTCELSDEVLTIELLGTGNLSLEQWAAQRNCEVLAQALDCDIQIRPKRCAAPQSGPIAPPVAPETPQRIGQSPPTHIPPLPPPR
ncbi:MAG: Ppx/GppA phosphatase family protein [Cyanobacteria bacterium P01_A01_bin.135]